MKRLSLRLRIFLFFCLIALGGAAAIGLGLWFGFSRLDPTAPLSAFVTAGMIAIAGVIALSAGVWLLFDDNVAKPIERLAAKLRARAHAAVDAQVAEGEAEYLGDIGPAAAAMNRHVGELSAETAQIVARETDRLQREKRQLVQILSDIPIAVMMLNARDQIVLYDGQAAALMEAEGHARLDASALDYFDPNSLKAAHQALTDSGKRRLAVTLRTRSGALYAGHICRRDAEGGTTLMLEPLDPEAERPMAFDFDLMERRADADIQQARIDALTYVVFDTETTGLDPTRDEIVQIGAVRVVNGKRIEGERFETLVNPGRAIPPAASRVHGVTDAMVADAPDIAEAGAAFHRFCAGAALVAHNAPFDLAFLKRHAERIGAKFDHPVLDTVLLSAVVYGGSETHTLDALCDRLSVVIPPELRHTAMGDAVATADALTRLIPMLTGRGVVSFSDTVAEMRQHQRLLKDMNG